VSSRWTTGPFRLQSVERRGIEPRLPGCKPSVFPLDQRPFNNQRSVRESNPVPVPATDVCFRNTYRPSCSVIPTGVEPRAPTRSVGRSCMSRRRLRRWTTGSPVTRVGVEPTGTRLSTSPLCRFAYPVFKWRVRELHPAFQAYETRLSLRPPAASCRPRYRAGHTGLMRASWAPAAPAIHQ
jgi:hypothetical protein